jgi:hypothetical protein
VKPGLVFLLSGIALLLLASSLLADDRGAQIGTSALPDTSPPSPGSFVGVRPNFRLEEVPKIKHSPLRSMLFSAVAPGLGQATNGRWAKASAFIAVGSVLVSRILVERDRADRYLYLSRTAASEEEALDYYSEYSSHYDRRDRFVWWGVAFWVYNVFDAYIDGHLFGFSQQ